jgi:hypothetical protein
MMRSHLPDELMTAAVGLLYTLGRIETILAELQVYVDKHVKPLPEDEPWPEFGYGVAHPLVVEASFEFGNFLGWLRTIDASTVHTCRDRRRAQDFCPSSLTGRSGRVSKRLWKSSEARRNEHWRTTNSMPALSCSRWLVRS